MTKKSLEAAVDGKVRMVDPYTGDVVEISLVAVDDFKRIGWKVKEDG